MKVYARDAMELKYCVAGQKQFCKNHNINFREFVRNGIDCEVFLRTKDEMAIRMVEHVRAKKGNE